MKHEISLPLLDPADRRRFIRARTFAARTLNKLPTSGASRSLFLDALAGGSALDAVFEPPPEFATPVFIALVLAGVHPANMHLPFIHVWAQDHSRVRNFAITEGLSLTNLFRQANFRLPDEMPESFVVWRGSEFVTKATAEKGESWTTSRKIACYFTDQRTRYRANAINRNPLLLRRVVRKSDIVYYTKSSIFSEVITDNIVSSHVDGSVAEWDAINKVTHALKLIDHEEAFASYLFQDGWWVLPGSTP